MTFSNLLQNFTLVISTGYGTPQANVFWNVQIECFYEKVHKKISEGHSFNDDLSKN